MTDVTVKHLDTMKAYGQGVFVTVGAELGTSSFGINVERWPPGATDYPEHDEAASGQEEVYFVFAGSATLRVGDEYHSCQRPVRARWRARTAQADSRVGRGRTTLPRRDTGRAVPTERPGRGLVVANRVSGLLLGVRPPRRVVSLLACALRRSGFAG